MAIVLWVWVLFLMYAHTICLVEDIVALTFWSSRYLLSNPLNHHSLSHLEEEKYFFASLACNGMLSGIRLPFLVPGRHHSIDGTGIFSAFTVHYDCIGMP